MGSLWDACDFLSLEAVAGPDGKKADLTGETLANDSAMQFLRKIHGKETLGDDALRHYVRHQDAVIRQIAAAKILGINRGYLGARDPGGDARPALMMECLKSGSPRVRRAMFTEIAEAFEKDGLTDLLTHEVYDLAVASLEDPDESWWVKDAAMQIIGDAGADRVVPQVDRLLSLLKHEEWWLRNTALSALAPVVADERCYRKVLPAVGELIRTNQRSALTLGLIQPMKDKIKEATPEVQKLAIETLREAYTGYTGVPKAPGGLDISSTVDAHLEYIAKSLADVPGGIDVLYEVAGQRYPKQILPYKEVFLNADATQFGPKLKTTITPIITNELIPEFVGKNRAKLKQYAALEVQGTICGGVGDTIDQLVALYDRSGDTRYDWNMFLDLNNTEWSYHTFDPIETEQVPFDRLTCRYRKVTAPQGMEQWFTSGFDAAKAGWKTGRAPFGNFNGKIPEGPFSKCSERCVGPICYGATKISTLWDKEVLMMRGTFKVPPLQDGHRYRIRANHAVHVGNGNGYGIWINGKKLIENDEPIGRGGGEKPYGAYITKDWLGDLQKGEVSIAIMSFIRYNDKRDAKPTEKIPQGRMSVHLDGQLFPPMGDDLVRKSASVVPMTSSEWQEAQFSESDEEKENAPLFRWDGKFADNPAVAGSWKVISEVPDFADFNSTKPAPARKPIFTKLTFGTDGTTSQPTFLWSGDRLMDLTRYQALRIQPRQLAGKDYLLIESGGFTARPKPGWRSPWLVLVRE